MRRVTKLEHPIAHINPRHLSVLAKKISSDDMSGLEPVVFLAEGTRTMLTMNLWSSVDLCNGATGTVVDIIYQNNHQPPDLPIAVGKGQDKRPSSFTNSQARRDINLAERKL